MGHIRHVRHTTAITLGLITLGLLTLTGCTGPADPAEPTPPPTPTVAASTRAPSPSSTPTNPATPTPPVMPDAATAHTTAGAKAFVRYFWDVVSYAQATGDTNAIAVLSAEGCQGCEAGISSIRHVYDAGGRLVGGVSSLSGFQVTIHDEGDTRFATSSYTNKIAAQVSDYPGSARDRHTGTRSFRDRITLIATGGGVWNVAAFEVES